MPETLIAGSLLSVNAVWDLRRKEILPVPTLLVLTVGMIRAITVGEEGSIWWITALIPGIFLMLLSRITAGRVGFGDGLVVCAAGIWCGTESILTALFFALLTVPAAAGVLWFRKQPVRELPFVPFLTAGFFLERILWRSG